jgi:hypothetical protein
MISFSFVRHAMIFLEILQFKPMYESFDAAEEKLWRMPMLWMRDGVCRWGGRYPDVFMLSFILKLFFLINGGGAGAAEGIESGSGVRTAELGRGMRIFGAKGALVDCGAGGVGGTVEERRDAWTGPGGNCWSRHGWRLSLIIFVGLSELELSVLTGGDGRLGGLMRPAGDSCAGGIGAGSAACCWPKNNFGGIFLSRNWFVFLKTIIP